MKEDKLIERFIDLRSQGISYSRIATELKVCKRTLIDWGRKHRYQIQNLRRVETEAMLETLFATRKERCQALADEMHRFEQELKKRDLANLPTARLVEIIQKTRDRVDRQTENITFTQTLDEIPHVEVVRWRKPLDWIA